MRAAVIVGAVGAGGIGTELVGTINGTEYHRATTLILLLVALVAIFDLLASLVRKYPVLLLAFAAGGLLSAWDCRPQTFAVLHTLRVLGRMWPPHLTPEQIHDLPQLISETLLIAFAGTALAIAFAFPLGAAAPRNLSPMLLHLPFPTFLHLFPP